jgi:hypothetical protein
MTWTSTDRPRDHAYRLAARALGVALLPGAWAVGRAQARHLACQWALMARFPAEDLLGLTPATHAAFTAARTVAFWRDGVLIGLTSGYRDAGAQDRRFAEEVRRSGSVELARRHRLPARESGHVRGIALDVRPAEGARWLDAYGSLFGLYRIYDNEWWHFEHRPEGRPLRLPHPGAWPAELTNPGGHQ